MSTTKITVLGGTIAACAAALSACGSSDSAIEAPTHATVDEFCESIEVLDEEGYDALADVGDEEEVDLATALETLHSTGTPSDTPDESRSGYVQIVSMLEDLDGMTGNAIDDRFEAGGLHPLWGSDTDTGVAFWEYHDETCGSL
jgi:uncharacterized protein (UPF0147 family)